MRHQRSVLCALLIVFSSFCSASPADVTSSPSAQAAILPPGYGTVHSDGYTVFCKPADRQWVNDAISTLAPTTMPTTMPATLIAQIHSREDKLFDAAQNDLGITDLQPLKQKIRNDILPELQKLQDLHPPVIYLPASREEVVRLLEKGWTDPRFHYLRFARDVSYDKDLTLSVDRPVADIVIWAKYDADASIPAKRDALRKAIESFRLTYATTIALLGQADTRNYINEYLQQQIFAPLHLPDSLQWFAHATSAVYAVKFASILSGNSELEMDEVLAADDPRNPLHGWLLDLTRPLDPASIRPELLPYYNNAVLHRGAAVVEQWIARVGNDALAKTLPLFRANPPQNSGELIAEIRKATGFELTPAMQPQYH